MYTKELFTFELEHPVESIKINGDYIWPIIRVIYYNALKDKLENNRKKKYDTETKDINFNLIEEVDILGFSTSSSADNDFILNPFFKEIFREKTSKIIYSSENCDFSYVEIQHYADILNSNICYEMLFENEDLLKDFFVYTDKNIDYINKLKKFYCFYLSTKEFLLKIKPKMIFISSAISFLNVIKVAKELNIKVIEIQHGVIINHFFYNLNKNFGTAFIPDYLLTFGNYEREYLSSKYYVNKKNIFLLGNYKLLNFLNKYKKDEKFSTILNKYKKVIGISVQNTIDIKLLDFVKEVADICSEYLFIWIPRDKNKSYHLSDNIIIIDWLNCYEIIQECDFHLTVYSTCAVESVTLGISTILVNIDNLSNTFFKELDNEYLKIINSAVELIEYINSNKIVIKKDLMSISYERNCMDLKNLFLGIIDEN